MLGGPGGDNPDTTKQMANLQVKSSFIQFLVAVGLINLTPYVLQAILGENVR